MRTHGEIINSLVFLGSCAVLLTACSTRAVVVSESDSSSAPVVRVDVSEAQPVDSAPPARPVDSAPPARPVDSFPTTSPYMAPQKGLMAAYLFSGDASDSSGNARHGTVVGAQLTSDRFGTANSAYRFAGCDDYIVTNWLGVLGSDPRTVSLWARTTQTSGMMCALSWGGSAASVGGSFRCGFHWSGDEGATVDISNGVTLWEARVGDGNWHHYAWVVPVMANPTTNDVLIYQDGQLLTTIGSSWVTPINTIAEQEVIIGKYTNATGGIVVCFSGSIDDVHIYDRALSSAEIGVLATSGPP